MAQAAHGVARHRDAGSTRGRLDGDLRLTFPFADLPHVEARDGDMHTGIWITYPDGDPTRSEQAVLIADRSPDPGTVTVTRFSANHIVRKVILENECH
jgi:hypothetical protein